MSISMWVLVLCASWLAGAALVAMLLGRMIRIRDCGTPDAHLPSLRELLIGQAGRSTRTAAYEAVGHRRVLN